MTKINARTVSSRALLRYDTVGRYKNLNRGGSVRSIDRHVLTAALLCCATLFAFVENAEAQTDEIQVYDAEITEPGKWNLTWHNNYIVSGSETPEFPGGIVPHHSLTGVPEWAYGVTDWFEAGFYFPVYTIANGGHYFFDSAKLRALFVVPHAHERSFFYGVNFELSHNMRKWDPAEFTAEIRPIIGWRYRSFDFIINPILDTSFDGLDEMIFAPAVRLAYNSSERWAFSLEHYAEFGPVKNFLPHEEQQHKLFAVVNYNGAPLSLEFGIGKGLTDATDSTTIKFMVIYDF